jgi:hypothetical protein
MNAPSTVSPDRLESQCLQALERANAVRLARAELKRRVAAAEISVADVVLDAPWEAASMTIFDLLTSQRRWGTTRCRKFLQGVLMTENKTVGSMTQRQRTAIAAELARTTTDDRLRAPRPTPAQPVLSPA